MCSTPGLRAGLGFHPAASLPEQDTSAGPWGDAGAWPGWEMEVFQLVDFSPVVLGCGQQFQAGTRISRAEQRSRHRWPRVTQAPSAPAQHRVGKSKPFLPTSQGPLASSRHFRWSSPPVTALPSPSRLDLGSAHPQNPVPIPVPSVICPSNALVSIEPAWHQLHPCWPRDPWLSAPHGGDPVLGAVVPQD